MTTVFKLLKWKLLVKGLINLDLLKESEADILINLADIEKQHIEKTGDINYKLTKLSIDSLATYLAVFSYLLDFELPVKYIE